MAHHPDNPLERLAGSIERVTFHAQESGFCVLQVKVRGQRDLVTVVGSAASVSAWEYVEYRKVVDSTNPSRPIKNNLSIQNHLVNTLKWSSYGIDN